MSAKHTPGPWKIVERNADRIFREISIRPVNSQVKGAVFPIASVRYPSQEFGQANARLIAAAPDLLGALQQWAHAVAIGDEVELINASAARDAAIAKAIG